MLDNFSRGAIVALTGLCVAGAVALAPLRAWSSIEVQDVHVAPLPIGTAMGDVANLPIARDPFAEPTAAPPSSSALMPVPTSSSGAGRQALITVLPSNLASDAIPAIPGTGSGPLPAIADTAPGQLAGDPQVSAIVTGAHPYAMVETGGVHEIKGLGDRIAGNPIVAIDIDGIRLQNGVRLTVDAGRP